MFDRVPAKLRGSGKVGAAKRPQKLHYEKSANALLFTTKQYWLSFQSTSGALSLAQELVVIIRPATSDLPRPRDLEPLRCRFVCPDFWHLFSSLLASD